MATFQGQLWTLSLLLACLIWIGGCATGSERRSIATDPNPVAIAKPASPSGNGAELPGRLRERLVEHIAQELSAAADEMQIVSARREIWPDGCLGLPQPDELCSMALVNGWFVEVCLSEVCLGDRAIAYRTSDDGLQIRRDRP